MTTRPRATTEVQTDTTDDALIPPGAEPHPPEQATAYEQVADQAILQVTRLAEFLVENFPKEIDLTNRQVPETPVDTAVRLLLALSVTQGPIQVTWCPETYCNRPAAHEGACGWVESSG